MTARKPTRAKGLGVTDDQYERLLAAQGGHCALCPSKPRPKEEGGRKLHVDHDHASGKVRGLLCHRCNRTVATWMDERWCMRAAWYLRPELPQPGGRARTILDEINGIGQGGES